MASIKQIVGGLTILSKYYSDPDDLCGICAEHDIIYAGHDVRESDVSEEDHAKLEELGWSFDDSLPSWYRYT